MYIIKIIDQTYVILQTLHFIKPSTIYFRIKVRSGLLGTRQIFPLICIPGLIMSIIILKARMCQFCPYLQ